LTKPNETMSRLNPGYFTDFSAFLICSWVKAIFVIKLFERFFRVAQNIVAAPVSAAEWLKAFGAETRTAAADSGSYNFAISEMSRRCSSGR
jgi:hypothetical protein